ncbi:MAG TPA: aminoacyl-tRNA hydrolase [Bacteroidota bacterium]|nr:aminoacyl-tRNA hydrolase [Bacteroidota bacterium]
MHVIVGLGNPGAEYKGTRHNIGFEVIDALAKFLHVDLMSRDSDYLIGTTSYKETTIALVKPLTYMNNSGLVVHKVIERYSIGSRNLFVIVDDFHLPFGTIRIREKGSDGGHNGLFSIIEQLRTTEFPRLRCGIANKAIPINATEMKEFVLSPFEKENRKALRRLIKQARDAALIVATNGLKTAMNRFNGLAL